MATNSSSPMSFHLPRITTAAKGNQIISQAATHNLKEKETTLSAMLFPRYGFSSLIIMGLIFREQTILITAIAAMLTTITKKEVTCSSAVIAITTMDKITSEIHSQNLIV